MITPAGGKYAVADCGSDPHREQTRNAEQSDSLGPVRGRDPVGDVCPEGRHRDRLTDALEQAGGHDLNPQLFDEPHRQGRHCHQQRADADDEAAATEIHDPPCPGPDEDRRQPGHADDQPDPGLVGAQLEEITGKVHQQAAAQLRSEGRQEDEREPAREKGLADHRARF